jgi:hypothetical protein
MSTPLTPIPARVADLRGDVAQNAPAAGQALVWVASTSRWTPSSGAALAGVVHDTGTDTATGKKIWKAVDGSTPITEYRDADDAVVKAVAADGATTIHCKADRPGGVLDVRYDGMQGKLFRAFPQGTVNDFPAFYIGNAGQICTTMWGVISGWDNRDTAMTPDEYVVYAASIYPAMWSVWSDVEGACYESRTNDLNNCYHFAFIDSGGLVVHWVDKDGSLNWGDGTRTEVGRSGATPAGKPTSDVKLYRASAGVLATNGAFTAAGNVTANGLALTAGGATFIEGAALEWPKWRLVQASGGTFVLRDTVDNVDVMLLTAGAPGSLALTANTGIAGTLSASWSGSTASTFTQDTGGVSGLFNAMEVASNDATGSALRLRSTAAGGHDYRIISTASGSGFGGTKLVVFDWTAGKTLLSLDPAAAALPAATAGATYGATERTMLQAVYDFVRSRNPQS